MVSLFSQEIAKGGITKTMKKTNAMRVLDKEKIPYDYRTYPVDLDDLSASYVAEKIGMPPEQVFKTLIARNSDKSIVVACLRGDGELDLKKLAALGGHKKAELVATKEILPLTGYQRGGCSPLGMKKNYPLFLDASARKFEIIAFSAGIRGCQILLSPEELLRLTEGKIADLCR